MHQAAPDWGFLMLTAVAGLLVIVAVVVVLQVATAAFGRRLPIRESIVAAGSLVWCLPAVGILAWVAIGAVSHLQPPQPPARPVAPVPIPDDSLHTASLQAEREPTAEELPAWTREVRVVSADATRLVLTSRQYSTQEEGEQEVLAAAAKLLQAEFEKDHPVSGTAGHWRISLEDVRRHAVLRTFDEVIETDFGSFVAPMHRVHMQVELSPAVQAKFYPEWRRHVVSHRLWILGVLIGMVTLMLGTSSAYFRLDALTSGLYRRRLKLAATSLITAGGLFTLFLLRS